MNDTQTLISQLIRDRRDRRGLTQADLAERIAVARNTINRWERGHNQPTSPQRRKLAKELGGKPDDYEWTEYDYEQHDKLIRIQLEAKAYIRRLMSGEEF